MGWLESPRKTTPENNHHYYTCNAVHEHCIKKYQRWKENKYMYSVMLTSSELEPSHDCQGTRKLKKFEDLDFNCMWIRLMHVHVLEKILLTGAHHIWCSSLQSLIKKKKVFNEAGQFHIAKFVLQTVDSSNVQRLLLINGE